jgi:hypothetical protein
LNDAPNTRRFLLNDQALLLLASCEEPTSYSPVQFLGSTSNNQLAVLFTLMFDDWSAAQVNQLVLNVVEARSRTDKTTKKAGKQLPEIFGISPKTFYELVNKIEMTFEENLKRRFGLVGVAFK